LEADGNIRLGAEAQVFGADALRFEDALRNVVDDRVLADADLDVDQVAGKGDVAARRGQQAKLRVIWIGAAGQGHDLHQRLVLIEDAGADQVIDHAINRASDDQLVALQGAADRDQLDLKALCGEVAGFVGHVEGQHVQDRQQAHAQLGRVLRLSAPGQRSQARSERGSDHHESKHSLTHNKHSLCLVCLVAVSVW